jgi:hypothetical protein
MMTEMEYSVLKEEMEDDECGWSHGVAAPLNIRPVKSNYSAQVHKKPSAPTDRIPNSQSPCPSSWPLPAAPISGNSLSHGGASHGGGARARAPAAELDRGGWNRNRGGRQRRIRLKP